MLKIPLHKSRKKLSSNHYGSYILINNATEAAQRSYSMPCHVCWRHDATLSTRLNWLVAGIRDRFEPCPRAGRSDVVATICARARGRAVSGQSRLGDLESTVEVRIPSAQLLVALAPLRVATMSGAAVASACHAKL